MRRSNLTTLVIGVFTMLLGISALASPPEGGYHLYRKVPLGATEAGGDYFDYIYFDGISRRVYVARGTEIDVLDADTDAVLGKITGLERGHGVAIVPELNRGFISDGQAAQAVIFDLKTLKTIGHVKAEPDADSIIYDPVSKHIFTFNGDANNATVIDPATGTVVATAPLGGKPEQAVSDGRGMIYNCLEDKNEVIAIDSRTLQIKARWPVTPAGAPVSIAMDREHRRLFVSGRNPAMMVVMNADNGKIIGPAFPIGGRVDTNIFDPVTGLTASSTGEGTIDIIHEDSPDKFSAVQTVITEYGAKTMALDPKTHNLLVDTSDFEPAVPTGARWRRAKPGTFHLLIYGR